MERVLFTKENIDSLLAQLAKEFKRLNGTKIPAEIVLIGGAAIVTQYGFRASTTYIDAMIMASSVMKDAINAVGDRNGLPTGWINQDFKKTSSYSARIPEFSKYYKTFSNIVEVRILPSEYLVAMKLASLRLYKYDMSDIVGIIRAGNIPRVRIEKAVRDLYDDFSKLSHPEEAEKLLDSIFSSPDLGELYDSTRASEAENKVILKNIDETHPELLKQGNIASVLEAAKRKKEDKTISE